MDDHLRIMERNIALAERAARADADGWQSAPASRRSLRSRVAATLVALAARLDSTHLPARQQGTELTQATQA